MTIERLNKTIEIMRKVHDFDDEDATIIVTDRGHGDRVEITTMDRKTMVGIALSKYVDWGDTI